MVWLYYAKKQYKVLLLGVGTAFFTYVYVFGSDGLCVWWQLCAENYQLEREIARRRTDCACRAQEIEQWRSSDYLREQVAREELQLMRKGEEIYYIQTT